MESLKARDGIMGDQRWNHGGPEMESWKTRDQRWNLGRPEMESWKTRDGIMEDQRWR